jgi:hypothetical protein
MYLEPFLQDDGDWSVKLNSNVHLLLKLRILGVTAPFSYTPSWRAA